MADESATAIPPERLQEMRKAIHAHLQSSNVYGQIREIVDTYAADHLDFNPNSPEDIMRVVKERGIIQEILGNVQSAPHLSRPIGQGSRKALSGLKPNVKYLHVRILGGRAFLDNLDGDPAVLRSQQMVAALHFGDQRFRCAPQECVCDPPFNDDFLSNLSDAASASGGALIDVWTPMHLIVLKEDCSFARSKCVGENTIDWRKVLKTGFLSMTVELAGDNPGVPSGIVELQLELVPSGPTYNEEEITSKIQMNKAAVTAADREFLIYARRWWADYHAIRREHSERHVKVFAATTSGRMIPVTQFICVLQPDRVLDSPYHAARFVSLLAKQKSEDLTQEVVTGSKTPTADAWLSPFVFLSQRKGDSPNHASLLCSLLLGYGLDAYCVVGTSTGEVHMFVVTRSRVAAGVFTCVFWEPTTGERFEQTGPHPYGSIGCVFNHTGFWANCQESDHAITCDFDLDNENKWKSMNTLKLRMVPKFPTPPLLWIPLNTRTIEVELEVSMKKVVAEHRDTLGLQTFWDNGLGFVLNQALVAYEHQRVDGGPIQLSLFHSCVKGRIGENRTFKGFPINVSHVGERKILSAICSNPAGKEIIELSQSDLQHCIRVRVFAFPEAVLSVWVMIGARYQVAMT